MNKNEIRLKEAGYNGQKETTVVEERPDSESYTAVNGLIKDTLKTLEDIESEWELDHNSQKIREKFYLLRHNLNHLRRFCEAKT